MALTDREIIQVAFDAAKRRNKPYLGVVRIQGQLLYGLYDDLTEGINEAEILFYVNHTTPDKIYNVIKEEKI